jgi:methylmalonyl-CoA/ethylmalonyl-CoA epimerase
VITRVHHVALVVRDLEAALSVWRDGLGLPVVQMAEVPDQRVRAALLACGSCEIELLTPTTDDSGVARFLASRGEALHHVCFESDDVGRELRRFRGTGVDLIDPKPRPGLAGSVAFVHPKACAGILAEVVTPGRSEPLPDAPLALVAAHARVADVADGAQRFQDLFGLKRGLASADGSFVQLGLAGVMLQLTALGAGFPRPALTALRLRARDLDALTRRLEERGIATARSPMGLTVGPDASRGAPLIVQPGR